MPSPQPDESFDNAIIGSNPQIDPDVIVGYRYHPECGPARIGDNCILHKGTVIYGDVTIGDHFHTVHYAVIRAMVKIGNFCTILNHSTIEGVVRMGDGVRIMSHVYIPSRTWFGDNVFVGPGRDVPERPVSVPARASAPASGGDHSRRRDDRRRLHHPARSDHRREELHSGGRGGEQGCAAPQLRRWGAWPNIPAPGPPRYAEQPPHHAADQRVLERPRRLRRQVHLAGLLARQVRLVS